MKWKTPFGRGKTHRYVKRFAILPTRVNDGREVVWLGVYLARQSYFENYGKWITMERLTRKGAFR